MIVFDPVRHQYKNEFTGDSYISVTTLLGKYKKPFDSETVAARVAKRDGKTVEEVLADWKKINVDSQVYGTKIHEVIENYNNTGEIDAEYKELIQSYKDLGVIDRSSDTIKSEELLYSHPHKLAGTADIIRLDNKGSFSIFDIKTNKKFNFFSQYNEQLLHPISHLPACEFTSYSLQLSLYALMYQNSTGKRLNQLGIFYYNRNINKFEYYPIMYMKTDVLNVLEHYASC